jgi:hypothetical protein
VVVVAESVVVGALDVVVVVVVVVGVVDVLEDPLEEDEDELGLDGAWLVVEELLVAVPVVGVPLEVEDPDPLDEVEDDGVLDDLGGFATRPLWFSAVSTSCCTVATSEPTAAGVPAAPRAGRAFSCLRSCSSSARRAREG